MKNVVKKEDYRDMEALRLTQTEEARRRRAERQRREKRRARIEAIALIGGAMFASFCAGMSVAGLV